MAGTAFLSRTAAGRLQQPRAKPQGTRRSPQPTTEVPRPARGAFPLGEPPKLAVIPLRSNPDYSPTLS